MENLINKFFAEHPDAAADQRTEAWKRSRLGRFTGSQISLLMTRGKGGETFGKTALAYIEKVASERRLIPAVVENADAWQMYADLVDVNNRYMRHGTDWEADARKAYESKSGRKVTECGFVARGENFGASPDGLIEDSGRLGVIEIKCPLPATYIHYEWNIKTGDDLKKEKPEYWWQMQAEMLATGAQFGQFVAYCPFLHNGLHIVDVLRFSDLQAILDRVNEAENIINDRN